MEGLRINKPDSLLEIEQGGSTFRLVLQENGVEVTTQEIDPDSFIWMAPADDPDIIEIYYVLSGSLVLHLEEGDVTLGADGSFCAHGLKEEFQASVTERTRLLCISNHYGFDELFTYQGNLEDLLTKINEKDAYTFAHGRSVMEISVKLMKQTKASQVMIDNIGVAALFHDIGKYYIPAEILTKRGALTPLEFRSLMKHPIYSRRLLEKSFGREIAEIAEKHHERLNGSGYPYGLRQEDIGIESRIIAIADTFDAMTSQRSYNVQRTCEAALAEMMTLTHLYDKNILLALQTLVAAHEIEGKPYDGDLL